jgi:mono/diheme cytochrome c family protein
VGTIRKASLIISALTLVFSSAYTFASPGADTFKARCAPCHGKTGKGDTKMGQHFRLRDLGSPDVQKQSEDELVAIIAKGKGKMPPYRAKLTREQIEDLVKFIRSLKK